MRKRIVELLRCKGKVKTLYELRKEWSGVKGSMAEEIIRTRNAE